MAVSRTTQVHVEVLRSTRLDTDANVARNTQTFIEVLRTLSDLVPVARRIVIFPEV